MDGQTKEERRPGYIAVLTAAVRYDNKLSSTAKLIFAEISALSESYGYAWCSNDYLERLFGLSERQVIRLLKTLSDGGYLKIEGSGTTKRRMWCNLNPREVTEWQEAEQRAGTPATDKNVSGTDKNVSGTDKNVSATDKNVSAIYNVREKRKKETNPPIPPEGAGADYVPKASPAWKPERFAGFWDYYPLHKSKQAAIRAWDKLRPSDELLKVIGADLRRKKAACKANGGEWKLYASTYLNGARWTDEPDPEPAAQGREREREETVEWMN